MINYLKSYEALNQATPVGMSYMYLGSTDELLASPAIGFLLARH